MRTYTTAAEVGGSCLIGTPADVAAALLCEWANCLQFSVRYTLAELQQRNVASGM
jgi:hypothetical protein